jgi:hypothetical protein
MPNLRLLAVILLLCCTAFSLCAQRNQREPLTDVQQEAIAEAGIDPAARVQLYVKYLNEHADTIKRLVPRAESARDRRLDGELQDFASIVDELSANLDEYGDRKADLRKALKPLNESIPHWQSLLHDLPNSPVFEISRNDAADSVNDLADQARKLTADQIEYFKEHPKAKDQEREEPE